MVGEVGNLVLNRVQQAICGLHGHDNLVQFEPERLFLRCASCGHESPGWAVGEPHDTTDADDRTARPLRLIGARRVA